MRKTGTWLAGIVLGLTLGWATSLLVNRPEVRADEKKQKPTWEYKGVVFEDLDEAKLNKKLQKLADEGWEYVGLISNTIPLSGGRSVDPSSVLFKRPKK